MNDSAFIQSIVRITDASGEHTLGTGFVVGPDGHIITAAHVVAGTRALSAEELPDYVFFEFLASKKADEEPAIRKAFLIKNSFVPFERGDLALLQYMFQLPGGVKPIALGSSNNRTGEDAIKTFGFPGEDNKTGTYGNGKLMGALKDRSLAFDVLQINDSNIVEGFSGAPVLNLVTNQVIGFVSWIEQLNAAYIIPTEQITRFLGNTHPIFSGVDISDSRQQTFHYLQQHQLNPERYRIDKVRQDTVNFITKQTRFDIQSGIDLLGSLSLSQTHQALPSNITVENFWLGVLSYLQYSKIRHIIEIIQAVTPRFKKADPEGEALIAEWKEIEENPYLYIFENYLQKLTSDNEIVNLTEKYVELMGEHTKDIHTIEQKAVEIKKQYRQYNEDGKEVEPEDAPRIDSILTIARDEERFIVIGRPGSGKTITLQKILFKNAEDFLDGDMDQKIPVFITANKYNEQNTIKNLILKEMPDWINTELDKSKFLLLIDGINEVNPAFQDDARKEIKKLLEESERTSFVISTRKYGFLNEFDLSMFELKPLQSVEVRQFIEAYRPEHAKGIWDAINEEYNSHLLDLSSNPLTLFMIIYAYDDKALRILPENRGGVYREFINKLLEIDKKKLHLVNREHWKTKEKALSELAMHLRKTGFNTELQKVFSMFEQTLGSYRLAVNLVHDLCSSHILRISGMVNGKNIDNHSIENAPENSTVSFIHETFLEYFCALEVKTHFLANRSLDIDFNQVEWFETLQLTSDLLEDEANTTEYLSYLFNGGKNREVALKNVAAVIKGGKQQIINWNYDLKKTFTPEYYTNFAIACKIAFNVKSRFPNCYSMVEAWLYRECDLWMRHANWRYRDDKEVEFMPYPVKHLLAAIAGLASPALVYMAFSRKEWQTVWLLYEATEPQLREREENVDAFINNLSSFSLLYDLLIELGFHLAFGDDTVRMLEEQLKQKMPLNLQKKLFERTKNLDLLQRIGRQDPEYFIEHFQPAGGSFSDFIDYLESFSANSQVQKKLIEILNNESLENEMRDKILIALLKKYYCVPQLLEYIQVNFDSIQTNVQLFSRIKRFLYGLPWKAIPKKLVGLLDKALKVRHKTAKDLYVHYGDTLILQKKKGGVQFLKVVKTVAFKEGYEYQISLKGFDIPSQGKFIFKGKVEDEYSQTTKNKRSFTISPGSLTFEREHRNMAITINGCHYKVGDILKNGRIIIIGPVEGTFRLNDKEYPFYSGGYYTSPNDYQTKFCLSFRSDKKIDFENAVVHFDGTETAAFEIMLENLISDELHEEAFEVQTLEGEKVDIDGLDLFPMGSIHPELFESRIIDALRQHIHVPEVQTGIRDANLTYCFHEEMADINFGMVVRIFNIYNSVEVYSPSRNVKYFINMPGNQLKSYKEYQLVIIEKDYHIHPFSYEFPETKYGFRESFIDKISKDYQYLFIHNPDCKDYFIHKSRINFIPEPFDKVLFYPSVNLSRRYYFYPLAALISRTGKGTYELRESFKSNLEARLRKAKCEVDLEKGKFDTLVYYASLLLEAEDYQEALKYAQMAVKKKPAEALPKLLTGDSFYGLKNYAMALTFYRDRYTRKEYSNDITYIDKLVRCYLETHNINQAYEFLQQYFRNNRVFPYNIVFARLYAAILSYRKLDRSLEYLLNGIVEHLHVEFADYFIELAELNGKHQEKAFNLFEKAISLQNSENNALRYAVFLYKMGDLDRSKAMLDQALSFASDQTLARLDYHRQIGKIEKLKFNRITLGADDVTRSLKNTLTLIKQKKFSTAFRLLEALKKMPEVSNPANECIDLLKHAVFKFNPHKMQLSLLACYRTELKMAFSPFLLMEYMSYLVNQKQYRSLIDSVGHSFSKELKFHSELQFLYIKALVEDALAVPIPTSAALLVQMKNELEKLIETTTAPDLQAKYRTYLVRACRRWMPAEELPTLLPYLDKVFEFDLEQFKAHDLYNQIKMDPESYKKASRNREDEELVEFDD